MLQVAKGRQGKQGPTAESSGCPGDKVYREGTGTEWFLCSVFIAKARLQEFLSMEAKVIVWEKEDFPLVKEDQITYPLVKADIKKSIDTDEMQP